MNTNNLVKCIISFVFGALYVSLIWIVVMFPDGAAYVPAVILLTITSIILFIFGIYCLFS